MSPPFVPPGPRQMKMKSGQALSLLCRYLKCRTCQKIGAHRSFTSTCWERLWISITLQSHRPFIFQFFFLNAALFPFAGIIFNAGAAQSALSRSRTPRRHRDEKCSIRRCSFKTCHRCLPPSLSPDALELSCLPKLLLSITDVTVATPTFSATWKLIPHL